MLSKRKHNKSYIYAYYLSIVQTMILFTKTRTGKVFLMLFLSSLIVGNISAQNAINYTSVRSTNASLIVDKNGNSISLTTSIIINNNVASTNSSLLPIGFDFFFMGKRYSHFVANSGGALVLGVENSTSFIFTASAANDLTRLTNYPPGTNDAAVIAAFWDALRTAPIGYPTVRTIISGTSPNRCRTIEWGCKINSSSTSASPDGIFQARLYESSGEIEFVYGKMAVGTSSGTVTASVGFTAGTGDNSFKALKNLSTYDFTSIASEEPATQTLVNSNVAQTIFALSSTVDGSRSRFTFTPVAANGDFSQLSFSNINFNTLTLNWTDNIINENQFAIYRSTDNINFDFVASLPSNSLTYTAGNLSPNTNYYWKVVAVTEGNAQTSITRQQSTRICSMQGTYKIGPGGNFVSIQAAMDTLVQKGSGGAVILELNQSYNPSIEAIPIVFKKINCADATSTITLRPEAGANNIKISSALNLATLYFNNVSYYRIDGRPGGTDTAFANLLTIENTNIANSAIVVENDSRQTWFSFLKITGNNKQDTSGIFKIRSEATAQGNDSIKIERCFFSNSGSSFPKNLFYAAGQTTGINDHIQLLGNDFSNHLVSGESFKKTAAIYLADNNNNCVVKGNSFYQTAARTIFADNCEFYEVYITNTNNGGNHLIDSNYIGGSAPQAAGIKMSLYSQLQYRGIYLRGKPGVASIISNNFVRNIRYAFAIDQKSFSAIEFFGPFNGKIFNNVIGSQSIDSSIVINSNFGAQNIQYAGISGVTDMSVITTDSIVIYNNIVAGIWGGGAGNLGNVRLYPINVFNTKNANIRNNIIGSTTNDKSITNTTNDEVSGIRFYDGFNTAAQTLNISIANNSISGLTSLSTGTYNYLYGIRISEMSSLNGKINITGNTIQNMYTASNSNGTNFLFSIMAGITTESPLAAIEKNTIKNLQNLPQAPSTITIAGIDVAEYNLTAGTKVVPVNANFIHSLGGNTANAVNIFGIKIGNGNAKVTANMVRLGTTISGTAITTPHMFAGIHARNGFVCDVLNNSVAINGSAVPNNPASFNTYAFYSMLDTAKTLRVLNNIFTNFRSNVSQAANYAHYAVGSDSIINPSKAQYDYNIYYNSGMNTKLGKYLSNNYDSLRNWKNNSLVDANSIQWNPNYISVNGDENTLNLHLQSPTVAEGSASQLLTDTDFDGEYYNNFTPADIGADAGNFTWIDKSAPVITLGSLLDSTGDLTDRLVGNVLITDSKSGVDFVNANNRPSIWFRKKNGNITSNWVYNFGTITNGDFNYGTWEFPITYSLLNIAPQGGDTIQYYIVAQDLGTPPNIGYLPYIGANHSNSDAQLTAPAQPFYYKLRERLPANITVGTGQMYPNFTGTSGLFKAINETGGLSTATNITVTSNLVETGDIALNGDKFNGFSMKIKPASATVYDIRNVSALAPRTFDLYRVKKLTVDGSFNGTGRYLQFVNGSETSNATVFRITGGSDSLSILNSVIAANTTDTLNAANIVIGTGDNINIVLNGNQVMNSAPFVAYHKLTGTAVLSTSSGNRVSIINNEISDFNFFGINLRNSAGNCVIDSNHFFIKDTVATFETPVRILAINEGNNHFIRNNYMGGTQKFCAGGAFRYKTDFGSNFADGIKCITVNTGAGLTQIKDNTIANFSIPYVMYSASFIGVETNGSGEYEINNNTVGSETQPNNIYSESGNFGGGNMIGIMIKGTGRVNVDNNLIANINNNYYSDNLTVTGIRNSRYTYRGNTITNNRIHHLFSASNGSGIYLNNGVISVCGIDTRNIATISKNSIHHLYSTDITGGEVYSYGMYASDPETSDTAHFGLIEKNRISNINNVCFSSQITGLMVHDGKWNIINNQVMVTNTANINDINIRGINVSEFVPGEVNLFYNTVIVGGNNGASFNFSYAASIEAKKGIINNNIFCNNRLGSGRHVPFATPWIINNNVFQFDSTNCNYNLFSTRDSVKVISFNGGGSANSLNDWRNASGADRDSYFVHADTIPFLSFFADTAVNNLNINNLNPYCWAVNGKGKPLAGIVSDFDDNNIRSADITTGSTDIGSDEFNTTTTPPVLRINGNHIPGGADTLRFGSRIVAIINWGNTGTLPQLGAALYYSGIWPNDLSNGGNVSNPQVLDGWWNIPASGGSGFTYSITFFYDSSILGKVTDASTMLLHKKQTGIAGTWQALPSIVNLNKRSITATGLNSFSEFTATSLAAPLGYLGNELCTGNSTSYQTIYTGAGYTYQWQSDNGSGFTNMTNGAVYSGVTSSILVLTNPPSSDNGTKYRCITNTGPGSLTSPIFSLKIKNTWVGAVNTDWSTASNWSCGQVPDANTNVIIPSGLSRYPVVSASIACKSLLILTGAVVTVSQGNQLTITGK